MRRVRLAELSLRLASGRRTTGALLRAVVSSWNFVLLFRRPLLCLLWHAYRAIPDPAEDLVEEALYSLEDNWTDIVERSAGLSERLKAQQTALWELISTELAYIRTLKVIQDVSSLFIRNNYLRI